MNWKRTTYLFYGLLAGSVIGSLVVIYYPNKQMPILTTTSVNSDTGVSEVTEILFNNKRCRLSREVIKMTQIFGGDSMTIELGGGYSCQYFNSKEDVEMLKKALDKAVELGWVK